MTDIFSIRPVRKYASLKVIDPLVKKQAWEQVDGYSHIDEGWEDYDFWLKFITHKLDVGYVPEILCRYRVHGKSRTANEAHVHHQTLERMMDFRHDVRSLSPVS